MKESGEKMSDLIRANIGGIDGIRAAISGYLNALRDEEKNLQEGIAKLGGMWEGEAHNVFQADLQQMYQKIVDLDQRLAEVVSFEERAVSEFGKAETEISSGLEGMK
jgi:WXG100 family type VII secretion target